MEGEREDWKEGKNIGRRGEGEGAQGHWTNHCAVYLGRVPPPLYSLATVLRSLPTVWEVARGSMGRYVSPEQFTLHCIATVNC